MREMATMDVHFVCFGMAADVVGATRGMLSCHWPITAAEVRGLLAVHYPGLGALHYHLAQGTALLSDDTALQESLELVILPPFAGG
jgi:hypothetical protein